MPVFPVFLTDTPVGRPSWLHERESEKWFRTVFRKKEKKYKNLLLLFIQDYCSIMNIKT